MAIRSPSGEYDAERGSLYWSSSPWPHDPSVPANVPSGWNIWAPWLPAWATMILSPDGEYDAERGLSNCPGPLPGDPNARANVPSG